MSDVIAEIEDGRINIHCDFRSKDLVKQIPGARWDNARKVWHTPITWAVCKQARGVFGDRLQVGPELASWAWAEHAGRITRVEQVRALEDTEGDDDLWPPQRVGVEFLSVVGQGLLGDEMGTGKTVQVLRTLRRLGTGPTLVVCPNTVKRTWERLAQQWTPELNVTVVQGGAAAREKQIANFTGDILVINWESLRLHSRLKAYSGVRLRKCQECNPRDGDASINASRCEVHTKALNNIDWAVVVADEAHHAKNPKALQTMALWGVSQKAKYRYALTGTPIGNTPDDLWAILHFLHPDEWPGRSKFIDRYCLTSWNPFGGLDIAGLKPETRDEFYSIFDSRFLRRPLSKVMPHLPEVVEETRTVEMSAKQAKAYKQMVKEQIAILSDKDALVATNPLAVATRLMQFAAAYAEVNDEGRVVLTDPSSKIDALMEIVADVNEPIVVFAESRQLVELGERRLTKAKIPFVSIHGQVDPTQREENVRKFGTRQIPVCFVTLGAGGEGLDGLQHGARVEVWLQRSWSLLKNKQGEGRLRRGGQQADSLLRIEVITAGTIEEHRNEMLVLKDGRFEEIVRDKMLTLLRE